ncbi:MAG: AAA family ATPase [Chloroflexota bacterium]|nr:AAA family ATPase [Chloroflexota bacterium]
MPDQRRLVTVLFADIVGSTALGSAHDPEVVRRTLARAFAQMREVLQGHGASVEKFIGDAVMAVFGIPHAHDDDADRAIRAAFTLRERIVGLNATGRFALELRVGVNSGQVVTGEGAETLVTGEAVNVGARLQQAAAPDEILAGPLTRQLTEGVVRYDPPRTIEAKGLGLIAAYPAVELLASLPTQRRGVGGLRAPLIGRDRELRLLVESHRKLAGEPSPFLVTVFGTAGVGKSRLVAEFIETIGTEHVLRGRCLPYGEGITYWPIVEILRADAGISAMDSRDAATRKLRSAVLAAFGDATDDADAVARRLGVLAGTEDRDSALPDVAADKVDQELRWGLRRYLERRAAGAPLTLVFDDIHWAEPALLDLIEHLTEWSRAPLFLLCMARPDLREVRTGWGGGLMNASAIRLEPLDPEGSARLIRELLTIDALPDALRDQIVARSEGNPLYVEEFLRMLIDARHIERRDGAFVATPSVATLVVPATLQGLIAARLDRVPPRVRQALQRAALVGKVFWPEALLAQGPLDGRPDDLLIEAARHDLVVELDERGLGGGRAWTFKHILIRDVAYDAIPKEERSRGHDAFGTWLETVAGERIEEYADIVGYHAEQAFLLAHELGEPDAPGLASRALGALFASGNKAMKRGDLRAALAFFRRARLVADAGDAPDRVRLEARGLVALCRIELEGSQELLDEIEAVIPHARGSPSALLVDLLQALSDPVSEHDPARARALDREAVAVARLLDDPETIARAMVRAHWVPLFLGDLEEHRRVLVEADAYIRASGARTAAPECLGWLFWNALTRGDVGAWVRFVDEQEDVARASGSPAQLGLALRNRSVLALARGDIASGRAAAEQALAAQRDSGNRQEMGIGHWFVADALEVAGDRAGAVAALRRSVEDLGPVTLQGYRAEARVRLAHLLIGLGDVAGARREAELARVEVAPNDVYTVASSTAALAAVHAAEDDHDEADRLYRRALELWGRTGYALDLERLRRHYAGFLVDRGRVGEARELLGQVLAFFGDSPLVARERDLAESVLRRCAEVSPS